MRTKRIASLLMTILIIIVFASAAIPAGALSLPVDKWTASDDGKTYYISKPEELMTMAQVINSGLTKFSGITFVMTSDIDMSGYTWVVPGYSTGSSGAADVRFAKCFSGTFDGNGYAIKNLSTGAENIADAAGLFGTAKNAVIKNLKMEGFKINGYFFAGAAVGYGNNTQIINCTTDSSCEIVSESRAGGFAGGVIGGQISYCVNNGSVLCTSESSSMSSYMGGIVGVYVEHDVNNLVSFCVNNGKITGSCLSNNFVGGIIGITDSGGSGAVENCVANGTLAVTVGKNAYVGGIAGRTGNATSRTQWIHDCYISAKTEITSTGTNNIGGVVGMLGVANNTTTTIKNCKYDSASSFASEIGYCNTESTNSYAHNLENNGAQSASEIYLGSQTVEKAISELPFTQISLDGVTTKEVPTDPEAAQTTTTETGTEATTEATTTEKVDETTTAEISSNVTEATTETPTDAVTTPGVTAEAPKDNACGSFSAVVAVLAASFAMAAVVVIKKH